MSYPVTGKRQTSENREPNPQKNKKPRTGSDLNQINGHSYTTQLPSSPNPCPSRPTAFRPFVPSPATPSTSSPRVSLLETVPDRSSDNGQQSLALPDNMPTGHPTISSVYERSAPNKECLTVFPRAFHQPPTLPPPRPLPKATDSCSLSSEKPDREKGIDFFRKRDYRKAIEHLTKALDTFPNESQILDTFPNKCQILSCLGLCYQNTHKFSKAIFYFSQVPPEHQDHIFAQMKIACCYLGLKEPKTAIDILTKVQVQESNKEYNEFHSLLADCYRELNDPSKAIEHYRKVSKNAPNFIAVQHFLHLCCLEERVSRLEMTLGQSSTIGPHSLPPSDERTLTDLAESSSAQERIVPPPAQPIETTAIGPSPLPSPKTDFEKGCEFLAKKEYEKAIEHYLVAVAAEPSKSSILYNLGRCYHFSKEYLKAIDCFSKIQETSKLYISAQLKLGTCYLLQNEPKKAIEILTKIQGIKPVNLYDEFHTILGKCHSELEDPSKAIEHYKKVSQNYSFFAHTQNSLGLCYVEKNEPQTAIGFFREALIFAGSDQTTLGYAHYNLGTTYLAQKEDSKARMHLKLVPKDHEKFDEAQKHLKQCNSNYDERSLS